MYCVTAEKSLGIHGHNVMVVRNKKQIFFPVQTLYKKCLAIIKTKLF